jgi:hypothetical protein
MTNSDTSYYLNLNNMLEQINYTQEFNCNTEEDLEEMRMALIKQCKKALESIMEGTSSLEEDYLMNKLMEVFDSAKTYGSRVSSIENFYLNLM